jgi:t-SNARE complex subunit (syntaxin)
MQDTQLISILDSHDTLNSHNINQRYEQIIKLSDDVITINELMQDLNYMIHDQGIIIESIEDNINQAENNVDKGTSEIKKASEYQKKSRWLKLKLALGGSVVTGVAIGLAILL